MRKIKIGDCVEIKDDIIYSERIQVKKHTKGYIEDINEIEGIAEFVPFSSDYAHWTSIENCLKIKQTLK